MNELAIYLLLVTAVAIGWFLGRRGSNQERDRSAPGDPAAQGKQRRGVERTSQYYQGLNYILDGSSDAAADRFITDLEVSSETVDTHIALGSLLRKRGEVERAIRVHQNLLGGDRLPNSQLHLAHLELARDYISAGLLDRAEQLLLDLRAESPAQHAASLRYLVEIYQSERDWRRAIDTAKELARLETDPVPQGGRQPVSVLLSHFHCELAQQHLAAGEATAARELLAETLRADPGCVRASLMLGELETGAGRTDEAIRILRNVQSQDPSFVPETIPLLRQCCRTPRDRESLRSWLRQCLEAHPSAALVLAVAEDMRGHEGDAAAGEFLAAQLAERPSFRGLEHLIDLQMGITQGKAKDDLGLLRVLVKRLISERPAYRCDHCGFSGQTLHWCCPGCQHWGTVRGIGGMPDPAD